MSYGTAQLIFLIIFLTVVSAVVVGTLVFVTLVDRRLAGEGGRSPTRENGRNEEPAGESVADGGGGADAKREEKES